MNKVTVTIWKGRWKVVYRDMGGVRRVKQHPTEDEAQDAAVTIRRQMASGSMPDDQITVREYVSQFLANLQSRVQTGRVSKAHFHNCSHVLNKYLVSVQGERKLAHLNRSVLKSVLSDLLGKYAPTTVHLSLAVFRTMFAAAVDDGVVRENPCLSLAKKLGLTAMSGKPKAMTTEQAGKFLKYVREKEPEYLLGLSLYLKTGLRLGEGLALRREDFDYAKLRLHVCGNATKFGEVTSPKTDLSIRDVQIPQELADMIRESLSTRVCPWILAPEFSSPPEGKQIQAARARLQGAMRRVCQTVNLPGFTIHCLRHTFAMVHLENGADLLWVSRQLGHSSIKTTADIYGSGRSPTNAVAVARYDDVLAKAEREAKFAVDMRILPIGL